MRPKLVHGTKSITCAKSVFPEFTIISQNCQARETTSKNNHEIQIDTKLFQSQTRVAIGFSANHNHVHRTVVMKIRTSRLMLKVKLRPILATVLAGLGGMLPHLVWAAADATTQGASTGPNLSGVGKVLGMVLFGYLVMKWTNRRKPSEDDEPRGFFGQNIKPVYVWLVLILGLIVLMSRTG